MKLTIKSVLALLFVVCLSVVSHAQNRDQRRVIQSVTSDADYVFAEVTSPNVELLEEQAVRLLYQALGAAYASQSQTLARVEAGVRDSQPFIYTRIPGMEFISWSKGREFEGFAYIKKQSAIRPFIEYRLHRLLVGNRYMVGQSFSSDAAEAISDSRRDLLSQIQVTIVSRQDMSVVMENDEMSSAFQNRVQAFSNLTLLGLRQVQALSFDDQFLGISYISLEDLDRSMELTREKVHSYVREGRLFEESKQLSRALQQYYKAYLYAGSYYKTLDGELDGADVANLRIALEAKIKRMIDASEIRVRPAYEMSERNIVAPFEFVQSGHRFTNLQFRFDFESTSQIEQIRFGEGKLNLVNYVPSQSKEVFEVSFWVDLGDDLYNDAYLASFEPINRIQVRREMQVSFQNVMKASIVAQFEQKKVYFQVQGRNLVPRAVSWNFGDGTELLQQNPSHTYADNQIYEVVAVVNHDENIVARAWVDIGKSVIHTRRPPDAPEPVAVRGLVAGPIPAQIAVPAVVPESVGKPEEGLNSASKLDIAKTQFAEYIPIRNSRRLIQQLQQDAANSTVTFGSRAEFESLNELVVVIADPMNVYEMLLFLGDKYVSLHSGQEFVDLASFASESRREIWIMHSGK